MFKASTVEASGGQRVIGACCGEDEAVDRYWEARGAVLVAEATTRVWEDFQESCGDGLSVNVEWRLGSGCLHCFKKVLQLLGYRIAQPHCESL